MLRACYSLDLKCPLHGKPGPQSRCYWEMVEPSGGGNWWKEGKLLKYALEEELGPQPLPVSLLSSHHEINSPPLPCAPVMMY